MFLLGCLAAPAVLAAPNVRLDSYAIEKRPLSATLQVQDAGGGARSINHVYVVRIKGVVPTNFAHPVQIFIGDMAIREYGATKDGIYFKVYDPQVLRQLHGKPFKYVMHGQPGKQTALVFNAPAE